MNPKNGLENHGGVHLMNILPFEMWTYQGYQCLMFFFKKQMLKVLKNYLVLN